jgi:hypothetical protein
MDSARTQRNTLKMVPLSSTILFFAGVFCLFGALLLVAESANFESQSTADIIKIVVLGGTFAIFWAFFGTSQKYWVFPILLILQFLLSYLVVRFGPAPHSLETDVPAMKNRLVLDAWIEVILMVASYVLFLIFLIREGNRFFRTQNEVRLAGEIHRTLYRKSTRPLGHLKCLAVPCPVAKSVETCSISCSRTEDGTPTLPMSRDTEYRQEFSCR